MQALLRSSLLTISFFIVVTAAAASPTEVLSERARALYAVRCALCHGANGKGDGPAARGLMPRPAAFSRAAWAKAIDDRGIKEIIVKGGSAVGKSAAMPSNPHLGQQPQLLDHLVALLRSFAPKSPPSASPSDSGEDPERS